MGLFSDIFKDKSEYKFSYVYEIKPVYKDDVTEYILSLTSALNFENISYLEPTTKIHRNVLGKLRINIGKFKISSTYHCNTKVSACRLESDYNGTGRDYFMEVGDYITFDDLFKHCAKHLRYVVELEIKRIRLAAKVENVEITDEDIINYIQLQ